MKMASSSDPWWWRCERTAGVAPDIPVLDLAAQDCGVTLPNWRAASQAEAAAIANAVPV